MELVNRTIEKQIEKQLSRNKVILIYGTRRVGKTMLMKTIFEKNKTRALMFNGEDHEVQEMLLKRSALNFKRILGRKTLLMIDEAQAIPDIGKILKLFIDSFSNLTVIASGSSSFDLMNKSGEPLTGRSVQYSLYPISFGEYENKFGFTVANQNLEERLVFGSYPEIINLETVEEKRSYLIDLVRNYLLKDIFEYESIKNSSKIFDLLKLLAHQVGSEVSLNELGMQLSMSKNTIERYLDLLTKVFIIFKLKGYNSNQRKEVVRTSKWYFYDNGIRNAVISDFRDISLRTDKGQLWENFCIYERIKKMHYSNHICNYHFWRTYDQQEIDLVEEENRTLRTFEFKWGKARIDRLPAFFRSNYPDASFNVITKSNFADFIL